ncbi:MAG TPA: sulfite exporter TauE/SafE family protein [Longimicrobiales bacterium]
MGALALIALFGVGLLVGFAAGLIGIGGGVFIVPFLYFFYNHPEWAGFVLRDDLHVAVAHATSLFVIVPTAIGGTWQYHKAKLIEWRVAFPVGFASLLGGVIGARLAIILPGEVLKFAFGVFLVASSVQMITGRSKSDERPINTHLIPTTITGLLVGTLSGMMGVGGGILALPLLMYLLHVDIRRAAATSLAIILFAGASSAVTYAVSGSHISGMPPYSLGYIHVGAGIPILLASLMAVRLGTRVNQATDVKALRYMFAGFFMIMGVSFIWENGRLVAALINSR